MPKDLNFGLIKDLIDLEEYDEELETEKTGKKKKRKPATFTPKKSNKQGTFKEQQ